MRKALSEHACPVIVACDATDRCNDSQQSEPMAELMREAGRDWVAPIANGTVGRHLIPAGLDTRYFNDVAVVAMERDGFDSFITTERKQYLGALSVGRVGCTARNGKGGDASKPGDGLGPFMPPNP